VDPALARDIGPAWADGFRGGLQRLDADCIKRFSVSFAHATNDQQDALLADWSGWATQGTRAAQPTQAA
jgi:hypothetical protein